jgi:hypothetical protein
MFLVHRFLSPWWWRHYIPLKRWFLQQPHGVTSQKMAFFRIETVSTLLIWLQANYLTSHSWANLSCFQKMPYYAGNRTFNNLPPVLKCLINEKVWFTVAPKQYLNTHSFYSVVSLNSPVCSHCVFLGSLARGLQWYCSYVFCIYMINFTSYGHSDWLWIHGMQCNVM